MPANTSNAAAMDLLDFYVGTFNLPYLFTLRFHPSSNQLSVIKITNAIGPHSWLSLSADQRTLYATTWTQPGSIAAYRAPDLQLLNSQPVRNKPGYVTCSNSHVFSVGGPTGEVFPIQDDGSIGELVQELDFAGQTKATKDVPHGDFGGLRHGAHGCDLSPDGKTLYVADIGRNCTWTFAVDSSNRDVLQHQQLHAAPRQDDGPRHAWPHPNGRILYVVQEHSSIVDVFRVQGEHVHLQGASILPEGKDAGLYWADEVRLSTGPDPKYLFASTRGLESHTKGYVSAFELNPDGTLKDTAAVDIWETPTSGGIANAIEPAPWTGGVQYMAMTDSEACKVFMLSFDGEKIRMVASVGLEVDSKPAQPATAVWHVS